MEQSVWVRGYRVVFAVLAMFALAYQFFAVGSRDLFDTINFFSYFTIQSNIIAAVVLLIGAGVGMSPAPTFAWDMVRGAAAMYMTTTGLVYGLLLAGIDDDLELTEPWINTVLHELIPLVMVADLLLLPLANRITLRQSLTWTLYPFAFLIYSLLRGAAIDWYPYPFLDPNEAGGYIGVIASAAGILVGFLLFSMLILTVSRHLRLDVQTEVQQPKPRPTART